MQQSTIVRHRRLNSDAMDLPIVELAQLGPLRAVLTTATAGDMNQPPSWSRICAALKLSPERICRVPQRHTRRVVIATVEPETPSHPADGMISEGTRQVLCVSVADCLPIFLIEDDGNRFALLHSGWRGTGIAINALNHLGRSTNNYHAIIGPGIGPCCYTVPAERAIRFRNRFGLETAEVSTTHGHIDLRTANVNLLIKAGIRVITVYQDCTYCSPALISYRADRDAGCDGSRRMSALIGRF